MPPRISGLKLSVFLAFILTFSACVKKRGVIETQLVITKEMKNIPTNYNIVGFDMYDENHIFAVGINGDLRLFLSSDGGASWNDITGSFNSGWNTGVQAVQSVVYMNEVDLAFVAGNKLYRSYDGGQSWDVTTNGFQPLPIFFAEKSGGGNLIYAEDFNSGWVVSQIYQSAYHSPIKYVMDTLPSGVDDYDVGRLCGNYLLILDYENDYFDECIRGFNLTTGEFDIIPISASGYDYPLDVMRVGNRIFLIRKDGKLNFQSPENPFVDYSFYNFHWQDYYSGEYMGDYYIAVGDKTISTNVNGEWEEAINPDISGQKDVFRKVKKIDHNHFYVSGNNGVFFKGTFK